jgi:tetratricopeptide (TPR) repeat protein
MKFYVLLGLMVLTQLYASGQGQLRGIVTVQNTGKPLSPASVRAKGATDAPTESGSGKFILVFTKIKPGQPVVLWVHSPKTDSLEIVPPETGAMNAPADAASQGIHLVVCPAGSWERNYEKWQHGYESQIRQQYAIKLEKLNRQFASDRIALQIQIRKLTLQRDSAINHTGDMALEMAQKDLSNASDLYKKAFDLFTNNHLDETIDLLDEAKIQDRINKDNERIANSEAAIKQESQKIQTNLEGRSKDIDAFVIKAWAYIQKLDWDNASRLYGLAVANDTTNYKRSIEAADFYKSNNENENAIIIYRRISRYAPSLADSLLVRNLLADTYCQHGDYIAADSIYQNNLVFYRAHAKTDSATFTEPLAITLINLAQIEDKRKAYKNSGDHLLEALRIYKSVMYQQPVFLVSFANTLNTLGNVFYHKGDDTLALNFYKANLNIQRSIHRHSPELTDPVDALAGCLVNLGNVYEKLDSLDRADSCYDESIGLYRSVVQNRPFPYAFHLSEGLGNYATFLHDRKADDKKIFDLEREAIRIDGQLSKNDPLGFRGLTAKHYNSLAVFFADANIPHKADSIYKYAAKSVGIRRALAHEDTLSFGKDYADGLINLARDIQDDQYQQSVAYSHEAVALYRWLMLKQANFFFDLDKSIGYLALIYYHHKDYLASLKCFRESLKITEPGAKKYKKDYLVSFLGDISMLCGLDEQLLNETADTSYLSEGRQFASKWNYCLDTVKGEASLVKFYKPFAVDYVTYFSKVDTATINWLKLINRGLKVVDTIKTTKDKTLGLSSAQHLGQLVVEATEKNITNKFITGRLLAGYHNLSWICLFAKRPDLAQRSVEKALALEPGNKPILTNLVLAYLYSGNWPAARKLYLTYKGTKTADGKSWTAIFLDDLDELEAAGITCPDIVQARALLKS